MGSFLNNGCHVVKFVTIFTFSIDTVAVVMHGVQATGCRCRRAQTTGCRCCELQGTDYGLQVRQTVLQATD